MSCGILLKLKYVFLSKHGINCTRWGLNLVVQPVLLSKTIAQRCHDSSVKLDDLKQTFHQPAFPNNILGSLCKTHTNIHIVHCAPHLNIDVHSWKILGTSVHWSYSLGWVVLISFLFLPKIMLNLSWNSKKGPYSEPSHTRQITRKRRQHVSNHIAFLVPIN